MRFPGFDLGQASSELFLQMRLHRQTENLQTGNLSRRINHSPPREADPVPLGCRRCALARSFTARPAKAMAERNAAAGRLPATRHPPAANTNNASSKATGIHDTNDRLRRSSANQIAGSARASTSIRPRKNATDQPLVVPDCLNLPRPVGAGKQMRPCIPPSMTLLRVRYDAKRAALAAHCQGAAAASGASTSSASSTT